MCVTTAFLALAACESAPPPPPPFTAADFQLGAAGPAAPEAHRILARGSNAAGVEIYLDLLEQQRLKGESNNVFISPASIFTAFGLLYAGADGSTSEEIARVMHFSYPDTGFHEAMGAFTRKLERSEGDAILAFSNAVWLDKMTVVEEAYFPRVAPYGAGDHRVDFVNNSESARRTINAWVEEKTHDRIKDLLKEPHVTPDTRSVLVNAIYMKMPWYEEFNDDETKDEPFRLGDGTSAPTPMMHVIDGFSYFDGPGFKLAALPYRQSEGESRRYAGVSMVVLLPDDPRGLAKIEAQLTPSTLESWLSQVPGEGYTRLDLKFPKLKINDRQELDETLQRLGMTQTFTNASNLTRLVQPARQPDGTGIRVSKVIHQTFIEADERGTEAAAATAIVSVVVTSAGPPPPTPIPFIVDHPFLFFIRDDATGAVIFMGRVVDPGTAKR